jgi:hypothetical protein
MPDAVLKATGSNPTIGGEGRRLGVIEAATQGLATAPALMLHDAERALLTPEDRGEIDRLRRLFVVPLASTLSAVDTDDAVAEAVAFWDHRGHTWGDHIEFVRSAIRSSPPCSVEPREVITSSGGPRLPDSHFGALHRTSGKFVLAHWSATEGVYGAFPTNAIRVRLEDRASSPHGTEVSDGALETHAALVHATAVAMTNSTIPAATTNRLTRQLWESFYGIATLVLTPSELDHILQSARSEAAVRRATGPAISRWSRRLGAGPVDVRIADDFDAPLPELSAD